MWKFLIIVVYFSPSIASWRLGNVECAARPEPQAFARISCDGGSGKCTMTCIQDYKFPHGETSLDLMCYNNEKWIVGSYGNLPECSATCSPACLNGGECVSVDNCQCPAGFAGHRCQTRVQRCAEEHPLPANSMGKCLQFPFQSCKVTCIEGYKFPDGTLTADLRCKNGEWNMEPEHFPRCEPECDSPCLNGGTCAGHNYCQCLGNFRGDNCEYNAVERCSPKKLVFNGTYKCSGSSEKMDCILSCPEGFFFERPSNNAFSCKYSDGFFTPNDVPKCDYRGYSMQIFDQK